MMLPNKLREHYSVLYNHLTSYSYGLKIFKCCFCISKFSKKPMIKLTGTARMVIRTGKTGGTLKYPFKEHKRSLQDLIDFTLLL